MNSQIQERTYKKISENQQAPQHSWTFNGAGYSRQYKVLPNVFSPAIFLFTEWLTQQVLEVAEGKNKFLEIGGGIGVTSIEFKLNNPGATVHCCDINPSAVENTKVNKQIFNCHVHQFQSDVFNSVKDQKFQVIYWNFPFHPSNKDYKDLSYIEKAVMDPGYQVLTRFLSQAKNYLAQDGFILLGFSFTMGDQEKLETIIKEKGYGFQVVRTKLGKDNHSVIACLVRLTPL